jgi:hypothetical protein
MGETHEFDKQYSKKTGKLLKEASYYAKGEPRVWRRRISTDTSAQDQAAQLLKAALPLTKGRLVPDVMVVHDVPIEQGLLHIVHLYNRKMLLPQEFALVLPGRIPRAAVLKRGGMDTWVTAAGDESDDDEFSAYLKGFKRGKGILGKTLSFHTLWDQSAGPLKIQLQWALQLIPLDADRFVFVFKFPAMPVGFALRKVVGTIELVQEAIGEYNYSGPPGEADPLIPTLSLLAVPELVGDQLGQTG